MDRTLPSRHTWRPLAGALAAVALAALPLLSPSIVDAQPRPQPRPAPERGAEPGSALPQHLRTVPRGTTKNAAAELLETEKERIFRHLLPRSQKLDRYLKGYRVILSKNFIIFTNGPRTTHKFKVTLEKLYKWMKKDFPFEDESKLLKCYVFKSRDEYFAFCDHIGFGGGRQSAGHATARYYATFYQSPSAAVVYHEAAHLIVNGVCNVFAGGSWFHEGTAVYTERRFANLDPNIGQKSNIRYGRYHPLRKLSSLRQLLADQHGQRNYAQAGSLLDFMIRGPYKDKFKDYIAYLRKHPRTHGTRGAERSIEAVYGMSLEAFDVEWMKYCGYRGKRSR